MLSKLATILTVLLVIGTVIGVSAQEPEPEVIVGETGFPKNAWGKQNLSFEVTNQTDWLKFLVVETDVKFEGSYATPHRVTRTNFILEPFAKLTVDPELEIPGNYGQMVLWLRIYDVVDTLDDMSLGVQLFEQPFRIKFRTPEAVLPYFEKRLSLPPMVGEHGMLDNEFERLMLLMLSEGKTLDEIAQICDADSGFVQEVSKDMAGGRLIRKVDGVFQPVVSVITSDYAADGRELADKASDQLAALLTDNLSGRRRLMDSLAQAGVFSNDSANFVEGGSLLFRPYPLVVGYYLWRTLGQVFITGRKPLSIFERTDPCNAKIGKFTYLVQGGDYYVGHHYYFSTESRNGSIVHFGDMIPEIECRTGFEKKLQARQNVDWNYGSYWTPEVFVYDTTLINPMLHMLDKGVEKVVRSIAAELRQLNSDHGHKNMTIGIRYWFWNLTATLTATKLVKSGTLVRFGNGQYRLMGKHERQR
ncbi:MAG: hypothetical protein J7J98_07765 [candidate division Zixibacteria bacterium]|nr:hypothetical protein [candidate division Zixibacteria bacterium]